MFISVQSDILLLFSDYLFIYYCYHSFIYINIHVCASYILWSRRGRDRMVVEFTTTCAISAYHH